jgi:hypothetical protein
VNPPTRDGRKQQTRHDGVQRFQQAVEQMPLLLAALRATPSLRVADHPLIPATPGPTSSASAGGRSTPVRAGAACLTTRPDGSTSEEWWFDGKLPSETA